MRRLAPKLLALIIAALLSACTEGLPEHPLGEQTGTLAPGVVNGPVSLSPAPPDATDAGIGEPDTGDATVPDAVRDVVGPEPGIPVPTADTQNDTPGVSPFFDVII